jgi:hypothetical protein
MELGSDRDRRISARALERTFRMIDAENLYALYARRSRGQPNGRCGGP